VYLSPNIVQRDKIKYKMAEICCMQRDGISIKNILVRKSENKMSFARSRRRWEDNTKSEVEVSACSSLGPVKGSCEHGIEFPASLDEEFSLAAEHLSVCEEGLFQEVNY
jgi:hypothetical protein